MRLLRNPPVAVGASLSPSPTTRAAGVSLSPSPLSLSPSLFHLLSVAHTHTHTNTNIHTQKKIKHIQTIKSPEVRRVACVPRVLAGWSTRGPSWGHPVPVLGAVFPFLEPFCGHLSPKIDNASEKSTLRYPHEGSCVVGGNHQSPDANSLPRFKNGDFS